MPKTRKKGLGKKRKTKQSGGSWYSSFSWGNNKSGTENYNKDVAMLLMKDGPHFLKDVVIDPVDKDFPFWKAQRTKYGENIKFLINKVVLTSNTPKFIFKVVNDNGEEFLDGEDDKKKTDETIPDESGVANKYRLDSPWELKYINIAKQNDQAPEVQKRYTDIVNNFKILKNNEKINLEKYNEEEKSPHQEMMEEIEDKMRAKKKTENEPPGGGKKSRKKSKKRRRKKTKKHKKKSKKRR